MMLSLDKWVGKTAIVTGASYGIGAVIAEKLVDAGMKVAAMARRKELLDELAQKLENRKGKLYPVQADLSKEEDILKAFDFVKEKLGPVHVLVNNAATLFSDSLCDGDAQNWRKMFDVNVLGLCIATREAVRSMKENNVDGQIIHINSIVGKKVLDFHGLAVYTSSKHAVTALAESLRFELNHQKSKIKVTSICPGAVATHLLDPLRPHNAETFDMMDAGQLALQPADVADTILFVLSTPPHVLIHDVTIKVVGETF